MLVYPSVLFFFEEISFDKKHPPGFDSKHIVAVRHVAQDLLPKRSNQWTNPLDVFGGPPCEAQTDT